MDLKMLIERVKSDDADALNTIYEAYVPMMRNVCFCITKADEDTVNDLVQDAFILAYYSLEKLNDEEKFGEWAAAITKNVSLKYLERKRKVKFLPLSHYLDNMNVESGVSADAVLAEKELIQLIDRLPEGYGKVFRMSVIEGLSHKEIAERLGIEPHSSSSQLARAKAMLRKMINRRMLAVISVIIVMIPLCKYLFQRRGTEEKKTVTAKVEGTKVKSKKRNTLPHNQVSRPLCQTITSQKHPLPPLCHKAVRIWIRCLKMLCLKFATRQSTLLSLCLPSALWLATAYNTISRFLKTTWLKMAQRSTKTSGNCLPLAHWDPLWFKTPINCLPALVTTSPTHLPQIYQK